MTERELQVKYAAIMPYICGFEIQHDGDDLDRRVNDGMAFEPAMRACITAADIPYYALANGTSRVAATPYRVLPARTT